MAQNITLMDAMAAQATICARRGYEVYIDGIVGAWFFDPWIETARAHDLDLRYVMLLPDLPTAIARATGRTEVGAMTDAGVAERMWRAFHDFAADPDHIVDTTGHTARDTVDAVFEGLQAGRFKLA